MKNLVLISFLIVGLFIKAQQPELLENTWYLDKLVIDDEQFFPPDNEEYSGSIATFYGGTLITNVCNELSGTIDFNNENSTFSTPSGWSVTLIECGLSENAIFENHYFYEFWSINFVEIPQPFHYEITSNENISSLVVTNSLGSKAYYNNVQLSSSESSNLNQDILLAFKDDDLIIKSSNLIIPEHIWIYDLTGQLVLNSKILNTERVNIKQLSKAIYFIKIIDTNGKTYTQKMRK